MPAWSFELYFTAGARAIMLRELNGFDELMIDDAGTPGILKLLNRLIVQPPVSDKQLKAEKIAIADRDYLLSGIYKYTFGSRIQSVIPCRACTQQFDIDFQIDDLVAHTRANALAGAPDADGYYTSSHYRFRLPDGEDELAVLGLPAHQAEQVFLDRCLPQPVAEEHTVQIQEHMEQVAPILLMNMQATCPECQVQQEVRFDMQSFLQARLTNERKQVAAEIHYLAATYRWSHHEILELPRSLRKTYAGLIGLE